jgi:hypothetical protein
MSHFEGHFEGAKTFFDLLNCPERNVRNVSNVCRVQPVLQEELGDKIHFYK